MSCGQRRHEEDDVPIKPPRPNLNKLSIEMLADAFTVEESPPRSGKVFAIYGQKTTLNMLSDFLKAVRPEDPREQLWSRPFVVSAKVPASAIVLGCVEASHDVGPEDFVLALNRGLEPAACGSWDAGVWGTLLRLT
jgi:hypothetical protein